MIDHSKNFIGAYDLLGNNCYHYVNFMINRFTDTKNWVLNTWEIGEKVINIIKGVIIIGKLVKTDSLGKALKEEYIEYEEFVYTANSRRSQEFSKNR